MAQSVWVATPSPAGIKLVDMTGKPQAAALMGGSIEGSHNTKNGVGAIVEAARLASGQGRRIVSATLIGEEFVFVVE